MRIAAAVLAGALLVAGALAPLSAFTAEDRSPGALLEEAARALGPAPRSPGGRFENWVGPIGHGSARVRFPFMARRIRGFFGSRPGAPRAVAQAAGQLAALSEVEATTVTWIGHATMLVRMGGQTFLTDPTWSSTASPLSIIGPQRFVDPGIDFDDLPAIDFVVVSHNHYDHLDLETLRQLHARSSRTRFFVPLGNAKLLRAAGIGRVEEFDWGDSVGVGNATVYCLPAQHWSKRGLADDQKALWASWAVATPEKRFFFAGDTGYFDGFGHIGEALGPFDLVSMPIGAYAPRAMMKASHLNPEEAARAAVDLRARRAVAMHFGTFDLSDEPLAEPPARWRAATRALGFGSRPASHVGTDARRNDEVDAPGAWVLDIGESRAF